MQTLDSTAVGDGRGGVPQVLGKRHADESSLNDEERFAKRLNLLSIAGSNGHGSRNSNYYIPVATPRAVGRNSAAHNATTTPPRPQLNEHMHLDDTRDRVYIHNLDEELADTDTGEEKLIFLPDIEKRLSKVPPHLLTGSRASQPDHQEVVLYGVPKSLTVDENHDTVRKAILETRQRAREKVEEEARHADMSRRYEQDEHMGAAETAHGYGYPGGYVETCHWYTAEDEDAMDLG